MADTEPITLVFLTDHGTQERIHMDGCSMPDARKAAGRVLRKGGGLYVYVEIHAAGQVVETIDNGELSEMGGGK
jgi:hypothetical protein